VGYTSLSSLRPPLSVDDRQIRAATAPHRLLSLVSPRI